MNERILIVDEDKNIRDLLASALKASGYGVLEAQSFAQARMLALSHCPDLMLLELNLPDGDGLDLIRFLRAQMDLPMVVVSVRAHQRDKAVSYTHLDVYKRQPIIRTTKCPWRNAATC